MYIDKLAEFFLVILIKFSVKEFLQQYKLKESFEQKHFNTTLFFAQKIEFQLKVMFSEQPM